jgi:hypothetical protein
MHPLVCSLSVELPQPGYFCSSPRKVKLVERFALGGLVPKGGICIVGSQGLHVNNGVFIAKLERTKPEDGFPDSTQLSALRAWYEGLSSLGAVSQYLGDRKLSG